MHSSVGDCLVCAQETSTHEGFACTRTDKLIDSEKIGMEETDPPPGISLFRTLEDLICASLR